MSTSTVFSWTLGGLLFIWNEQSALAVLLFKIGMSIAIVLFSILLLYWIIDEIKRNGV